MSLVSRESSTAGNRKPTAVFGSLRMLAIAPRFDNATESRLFFPCSRKSGTLSS